MEGVFLGLKILGNFNMHLRLMLLLHCKIIYWSTQVYDQMPLSQGHSSENTLAKIPNTDHTNMCNRMLLLWS